MNNLESELSTLEKNYRLLKGYSRIKNKSQINDEKKAESIRIMEIVCDYYGIKFGVLMSPYRGELVTQCRQMAMYIVSEKTGLKPEEIAQLFLRDRTTFLYSYAKIDGLVRHRYRDDIKNDLFNLSVLI